MKRAVVLQHVDLEGPARIAELLSEQGYAVDIRLLHAGDDVPVELPRNDLLIVMGGPMGIADLASPEHPYLRAEVELLQRRLVEDAPVLGICLGAQLLAHAAGACVSPMRAEDGQRRQYEVGWASVRFHPPADSALLAGIPSEAVLLHWHGDAFELPTGARHFASSALCRNQAFVLGSCAFALQFHPEATALEVESFAATDPDFLVMAHGAGGLARIRADTERYLASYRRVSDRLLVNILQAMSAGAQPFQS
jgi:GMP synthase (glutamine-hydrolysing)